ncbi:hypothetical protein [Komagataeibacter oboediens]|uniref:Uncharacterized protein n=1 Tax=Komagataeibacter oboediens TaxID=65958 RepID=A0A318QFH5_9PROT|nr:hypothetical protein [Komagataeibacter oboediens]PYD78356.1 hypothetical protein CFR80_16625 [Komagataeibacter oboediens]GBQ05960.1 hypothetical protein AA11826_2174 [Komagataeibacter oboediens DSM 11826]GCE78908.1 hypothetical protein MSKU3_0383 [Komagataeibacter oboediens]
MRPHNDNTSPDVLHFPRRNIFSPQEASHYLGIAPLRLRIMKWLRCGPKPISINRETFYTEAELRSFRLGLIRAVGVEENGGPYRERYMADTQGEKPVMDPLVMLLSANLIRRRAIGLSLWGLLVLGIGIDLILF